MPAGRVVVSREQKKALVYELVGRINAAIAQRWKRMRYRMKAHEGWRNFFHLIPDIDGMRLRMVCQRSARFWHVAKGQAIEVHAERPCPVELVIEE